MWGNVTLALDVGNLNGQVAREKKCYYHQWEGSTQTFLLSCDVSSCANTTPSRQDQKMTTLRKKGYNEWLLQQKKNWQKLVPQVSDAVEGQVLQPQYLARRIYEEVIKKSLGIAEDFED